MELGSKQHKQLLLKGIYRTAFRTLALGLIIAGLLSLPSLVRENDFSLGLFYLGAVIALVSLSYTVWIAYQKYQKVIKPFNRDFNQSE